MSWKADSAIPGEPRCVNSCGSFRFPPQPVTAGGKEIGTDPSVRFDARVPVVVFTVEHQQSGSNGLISRMA